MKVILSILLICQVISGRPSAPVVREFGTQPNNPNVKIFSTYPTEKPVVIQDNPNDLEKGNENDDKLLKDEKENTEFKGEEIVKAEKDILEKPIVEAESLPAEEAVEEIPLSIPEAVDIISKDESEPKRDIISKDIASQLVDNVQSVYVESDIVPSDENLDELLPVEEAPFFPETEVIRDLITGEVSFPIVDEEILAISDPEAIIPIAMESSANILPPITEYDIEYDDDDIYVLADQQPVIEGGVILPEFIPVDTLSLVEVEEQQPFVSTSDVENISSDSDTAIQTDTSLTEAEPIIAMAETADEKLEPMVSMPEESTVIEPITEAEGTVSLPENEESVGLPVESEGNPSEKDESLAGELGVSTPVVDSVVPFVEAEPEMQAEEVVPENKLEEYNASELSDSPREKISLKIKKADEEKIVEEVQTESDMTEILTEMPMQMGGFMSDESKTSPETKDTTIPSTTELIFVLNFNDDKQRGAEESPAVTEGEPEVAATEVVPPESLDDAPTVEVSDNVDKTVPETTTENLPEFQPMELLPEEEETSNNDPTLNEAI